ncbi:DNA-binding response regulator [Parapedobacter pyrenivorans]|uniref:DNA-binding response regulator n=1 Tax=Parapedobacter pyrenivorans TaxID=1305674 RepID=A0A917I1Z2_9SPHI|nr:response regulator transcription factor [Parapedobacter pyrenivorans]GGH04388.1 DNA-binding response regulator [Parapedobacter pyrenivorans]
MENPAKIIWASPPSLSRDGIIALLEQEPDFTFAETISTWEDIVPTLSIQPSTNLLVVDHLFLADNQRYLPMLKEIAPLIKVLVLSGIEYDEDILSLMKSGADGYIVNEANKDELIFAIKHILAGNTYICTALYLKVLESIAAMDVGRKGETVEFSEREEQILKLILEGYSNQEIAYQLFTNKRTILKYRENLLQKTGAPDIGTVIRMALQQGVLN